MRDRKEDGMEASARRVNRDEPRRDDLPPDLVHEMDRDDLSRMVREANDAGASFQQLADRAIDPQTGTTLSKPYLQKLSTNSPDMTRRCA
jgi:hypothetical protein